MKLLSDALKNIIGYFPRRNSRVRRHVMTQPAPGIFSVAAVLSMTLGASQPSVAQEAFLAGLKGLTEAPPIFSSGVGGFAATSDGSSLNYTLSYSGLVGTVTQAAHIHFGQPGVNGGIIVFLCAADGNPIVCPPPGQGAAGTLTAGQVQAVPDQGIAAGDFAALLKVMRDGAAYVNVHTDRFPNGEIRGDIISGP
jgi:CHRD domain.